MFSSSCEDEEPVDELLLLLSSSLSELYSDDDPGKCSMLSILPFCDSLEVMFTEGKFSLKLYIILEP